MAGLQGCDHLSISALVYCKKARPKCGIFYLQGRLSFPPANVKIWLAPSLQVKNTCYYQLEKSILRINILDMQALQGKTALITGAGKGLGRAMALALAAEGVNLLLISRTLTDIEKVAEEAKAIYPGLTVQVAAADIGQEQQVKAAVTQLTQANQRIDILINNAGTLMAGGILDLPTADWERVIQVNLMGTYYLIKEVLPFILKQEAGDIINIASTAGLKGSADFSAYGASKAAVINLSEAVMQEVRKKGVRVTTVNPSTIATAMTLDANFTDGNPERVLQPEDLAFVVVNNLKLPARAFVKDFSLWSTNP